MRKRRGKAIPYGAHGYQDVGTENGRDAVFKEPVRRPIGPFGDRQDDGTYTSDKYVTDHRLRDVGSRDVVSVAGGSHVYARDGNGDSKAVSRRLRRQIRRIYGESSVFGRLEMFGRGIVLFIETHAPRIPSRRHTRAVEATRQALGRHLSEVRGKETEVQ